MSISSPPNCAYSCVYNAELATNCLGYASCLCVDQTYLNEAVACVQSQCDASDQSLWFRYGEQSCASVGLTVNFSTIASSPAQATATAGATTAAATSSNTSPSNPSVTPTSSPEATPSSSDSGSGSGGLSVGDKATIAGTIVGGLSVIIAILALVLDKFGMFKGFFATLCCRRSIPIHNPQAELAGEGRYMPQSHPNIQGYTNPQTHPMY